MTYAPRPTGLDEIEQLEADNPIPQDLYRQIAAWIEPHTMNTYTDHGDAMGAVRIAYPLILAYLAEHGRQPRSSGWATGARCVRCGGNGTRPWDVCDRCADEMDIPRDSSQ